MYGAPLSGGKQRVLAKQSLSNFNPNDLALRNS